MPVEVLLRSAYSRSNRDFAKLSFAAGQVAALLLLFNIETILTVRRQFQR